MSHRNFVVHQPRVAAVLLPPPPPTRTTTTTLHGPSRKPPTPPQRLYPTQPPPTSMHRRNRPYVRFHRNHSLQIGCIFLLLILTLIALIYYQRNSLIYVTPQQQFDDDITTNSRGNQLPILVVPFLNASSTNVDVTHQTQRQVSSSSSFLRSILSSFWKPFNAPQWNLNPHLWSYEECRQQRFSPDRARSQHTTTTTTVKSDATTTTRTTGITAAITTTTTKLPILLDIISTGSITKLDYLQTQQYRTFGQHDNVRYFFPITEYNDTDRTCSQQLSLSQYQTILQFCQQTPTPLISSKKTSTSSSSISFFFHAHQEKDYTAWELRQFLFGPKQSRTNNHLQNIGWLCAQQRPIDGLRIAIEQYRRTIAPPPWNGPNENYHQNHTMNKNNNNSNSSSSDMTNRSLQDVLPDYLIFIDDDTYIHVDILLETLIERYPSNEVHVMAGCVYHKPRPYLAFPWGGYGTILSRAALQRLLQPIYCTPYSTSLRTTPSDTTNDNNNNDDDDDHYDTNFAQYVCWRIYEHNYIQETSYFQNGMSVADLMIAYMQQLPFTKVQEWNQNHTFGYCFHSDHILAYFLNFYFITVRVLPPFPSSSSSSSVSSGESQPPRTMNHLHQSGNKSDDTTFRFMEELRKQNPIRSMDPCRGTECAHVGYTKCQLDFSPQQRHRRPQPHICHNIEPKDMLLLYANERR